MSKHSETTVTTSDGTELFVQTWTPSINGGAAVANVLILHGYLEHSGRYNEVAQALNAKNIAVTSFDFRGHGKSSGARGYIGSWSEYLQDAQTVLNATITTSSTIPIFILGHSNGGLVTLDYFHNTETNENIRGIVITSPFLKAADDLGCVKTTISKVFGTLFPSLSMPADVKSSDLTHDEELIKAHKEDPLVLKEFTLGWAYQAIVAQARVLSSQDFSYPILFIYAGDDKISSVQANQDYAEALQQDDKTVLPRKGEYHEVLNEVGRKELYVTISDWILKRV